MNKFLPIIVICLLAGLAACGQKDAESQRSATARGQLEGTKDSLSITLTGRDSVTVLELLKESHKVRAISTAAGTFVAGIDSVSGNTSLFWVYSVNDTNPEVACDKVLLHAGDRVVWHLRKM